MFKNRIILGMLILGLTIQMSFAENVKFKSDIKDKDGNPVMLTGILTKPEGKGPFPAVVLLHGASGMQYCKTLMEPWSNRLVNWGYVTLQVDSFGPRGVISVADYPTRLIANRARDAYDAKSFLADLSFVDKNRIAALGWSHGGVTILTALYKSPLTNEKIPFRAAVAFYPYCSLPLNDLNAPLLILIGEKDDWCPASSCYKLMPNKPQNEVILKIYPGAYHSFDWTGKDEIHHNHRLLYDPIATQDATLQVKNFLTRHVK
jgi:dienelactone hydrolase